jgi:polar amino acid transport system ATP-binding protein/sulfate transport system ATP-binding protein
MSQMPHVFKGVLVRIQDVTLKFGDRTILAGITAEVRDVVRPGCSQGQVVGVLGPSGVGKSQLSRILSGLQAPTTGSVLIGVEGEPVRAGIVGMVAQNYPLLRHRTVFDNLLVAAHRKGLAGKAAEDKASEFLARFDLSDKAGSWPSELSGGQRQRVAIAQQLLCSDHFLVMDEPFTGLDPVMKDRTCDLIRQVSLLDEHNTLFIVAHDLAAVSSVADTLWLIGRQRGPSGENLGSRIVQVIDLIERGIAWDPEAPKTRAFDELLHEVRARFNTL